MQNFAYLVITFLIAGAPWILMAQTPPVPSLMNEVLATLGWAMTALLLMKRTRTTKLAALKGTAGIPLWILAVLSLTAAIHFLTNRIAYPSTLTFYFMYLMGAAMVFMMGYSLASETEKLEKFCVFFATTWIAFSLLNVFYGLYQYMINPMGNYPWIAALQDIGRIYGNIRQPNHYATYLVIAMGCTLWLFSIKKSMPAIVAAPICVLLLLGVALSGSRTGAVGILWVAFFSFFLNSERRFRIAIPACLLACFASLYLMLGALNEGGHLPHFGTERLMGDLTQGTGSRWQVWEVTIQMILQNPWLGVGVGRYQFFYLLGDWSNQTDLLFSHAHNVILQISAENGLMAGVLIFTLAVIFVIKIFRRGIRHTPEQMTAIVAAPIMIHSLFEYPLWYTFFLFPFFFFLGTASGFHAGAQVESGHHTNRFHFAGTAIMIMVSLLVWSAQKAIEPLYTQKELTIQEKLTIVEKSYLFLPHADHALLVTSPLTLALRRDTTPTYQAVAQVFMDDRLTYRWAMQSFVNGDLESAKKLAQALQRMNPALFRRLQQFAQTATNEGLPNSAAFESYLNNPSPTKHSIRELLSPPTSP